MKKFLKATNVLADLEERYCYAKDASNLTSDFKIPDLVVFVETIEEVQKVLKYAHLNNIPVIARGAGTNMVGACVCKQGGIVLNFSKMNKILEINQTNLIARVQPGVILEELKKEADKMNLFYPPDPSNYRVSTVGGSIAQSSGGAMSFKYGTTKDYVLSLKVVMADGSLVTFGTETSKNSSGYHIAQLIVGSEGTLGVVVEATLKLIPKPESKSVILAYFNKSQDAINSINKIIAENIFPSSLDFMDRNSMETVEDFIPSGLLTEHDYLLLIDLDGFKDSLPEQIIRVKRALNNSGAINIVIPNSPEQADLIWRARHSSFAAATRLAPDVISDDIVVPRDKLAKMIDKCNEVSQKYSLKICLVGHIGDGNIHPQFVLNLDNKTEFKNYHLAKSEIYAYAYELGGGISAEHGIGLEKLAYFEKSIDKNEIEYMKMIKKIFDPKNILNPGKIFDLEKGV